MKVTIEFNLPDDQWSYKNAQNADTMRGILSELAQGIRNETKYSESSHTSWEHVKEWFWEIMKDHDFDPWGS